MKEPEEIGKRMMVFTSVGRKPGSLEGKSYTIQMSQVQVDPMEPPRFQINKKIPRGPPSPPPQVCHSPPRKATKEELMKWNIPPCVSNWKNARGFSIPLANRVAADGRGLQQTHVNEKFALLSEALDGAERTLRSEVDARNKLERQAEQKKKASQEIELQRIAQEARERKQAMGSHGYKGAHEADRDALRRDRDKERARARNLARSGAGNRSGIGGKDRDISEMIALGVANPRANTGDEDAFDRRLFNQSAGLDSGFAGGQDDLYNVYDQPWRSESNVTQQIYRPSKARNQDMNEGDLEELKKQRRFVPDKGFAGTETGGTTRDAGPVQYVKDQQEEDPFYLAEWLSDLRKADKRPAKGTEHSEGTSKRKK